MLSAEERKALLDLAVKDLTREVRASLERQGEFEAVLVRGTPVNHVLHFVVLVCLFALVSSGGRFLFSEVEGLVAALVLGCAYGLFWLGLTLTGGQERELIRVDERGRLTSSKSGRSVESRGTVLRIAIPGAVIVLGIYLGLGLIHDIAFPPPPNCNVSGQHLAGSDPCLKMPDFANLTGATPSSVGAPGSEGGQTADTGTAFTVDDTKVLERFVRGFQLVVFSVFTLAAVWFLRRMLNGKGVLWIEPIRRKRD